MKGLVASMLLSTIILAESSLAEGRLPKVRLRGWANEQQRPVTQTTNPVFPRKVSKSKRPTPGGGKICLTA